MVNWWSSGNVVIKLIFFAEVRSHVVSFWMDWLWSSWIASERSMTEALRLHGTRWESTGWNMPVWAESIASRTWRSIISPRRLKWTCQGSWKMCAPTFYMLILIRAGFVKYRNLRCSWVREPSARMAHGSLWSLGQFAILKLDWRYVTMNWSYWQFRLVMHHKLFNSGYILRPC